MIIPKHYENLNMLHENTMPYRSYYVPASARMGALVHDREKSDRIEFLNAFGYNARDDRYEDLLKAGVEIPFL